MSFANKCEEYFGTRDLYEVLKIKRSATSAQVKKAYHKASLHVHPDRVSESEKLEATEKFKVISKIYSILSDDEKRNIYDENGCLDDDFHDSLQEWINIFDSMFNVVTTDAIDKHKREYIDSEREVRDIKKAYESTKGDMTKMHDVIPFLDCDNEERVMGIVRKLIDKGEVEEYDGFFNESKAKKMRRRKKEQEDKLTDEEAEKAMQELDESRKRRSMQFIANMAALEAKYCQQKKKKVVIKGTANNRKVVKGRVTKRTRK